MKANYILTLALSALVDAHGYVKFITVDGTTYPGYDPMVDARFRGARRIGWAFPKQNTVGVGPVLDVTSPDIACRKGATAPTLIAPARAGSSIKFSWSNYFTSHKGPVLTYMGQYKAGMKPQDVKFFKIDENSYNPRTHDWGTDLLIKQNNTWTVRIPSDIKPGKYVVRHELIALHFGFSGNPKGAGTASTGAQLYPDVTGAGRAEPAGVKFPGAYKPNDPGILYDLYYGPNAYTAPGPKVYAGKHDPPVGPKPVVRETGFMTGTQKQSYDRAVAAADSVLHSIVKGVNEVLPGGGGYHWDVGFGSYNAPVNKGQSTDAVGNLYKGGLLPTGVVPGIGYVGKINKQGAGGPMLAKARGKGAIAPGKRAKTPAAARAAAPAAPVVPGKPE